MEKVLSKDGAAIAFDRLGDGPPLILVTGALGDRSHPMQTQLAALLAEHFTMFNYDRRGDSGDTTPCAVEREIEDIEALINEAGGSAFVYGISSGAILALKATGELSAKVEKLALYEPPFILGDSRPPLPENYVEQLDEAIAAGDRGAAVEVFMTQALLIPAEYLEPMRNDPMWADMEKLARTVAYDGRIVRDVMAGEPWPENKWVSVTPPTLVISGEMSEPFFHHAAKTLADDLADAQYRVLEGQTRDVAPEALAPVLVEYFAG